MKRRSADACCVFEHSLSSLDGCVISPFVPSSIGPRGLRVYLDLTPDDDGLMAADGETSEQATQVRTGALRQAPGRPVHRNEKARCLVPLSRTQADHYKSKRRVWIGPQIDSHSPSRQSSLSSSSDLHLIIALLSFSFLFLDRDPGIMRYAYLDTPEVGWVLQFLFPKRWEGE